MAYDFLELTNAVLRRFNEVPLTSTTFAGAKGFHHRVKDAVNAALRDIFKSSLEWPFNHVTYEQVLTPGQVRYAIPSDARIVDIESARLKRDDSLNANAKWLCPVSYDEYLQKHYAEEHLDEEGWDVPDSVFLDRANNIGFFPAPDKAYTVEYEYYQQPDDLVAYDDVPTVPAAWKHVIVDGATYRCHIFRENVEAAALVKQDFEQGMVDMRRNLINRNEYIRSTMRPWIAR